VAIIEDNGRGFDVDELLAREQSLGLHVMRERSFLVGGKLTIESSPGAGTTVFVQVPLGPAAESAVVERGAAQGAVVE